MLCYILLNRDFKIIPIDRDVEAKFVCLQKYQRTGERAIADLMLTLKASSNAK